MKKIMILTAGLFFAFSAFAGASSYQERVDSWGKSNSGSVSKSIGDGDEPTPTPGVGEGPIGSGLFILSLFAGGYALVNKKRNLKKSQE